MFLFFRNTNITNQVLGDAENKTIKATFTMGYYDNRRPHSHNKKQ